MRKLAVLIVLVVSASHSFCQTDLSKAQAMFIYNFSRLIEWPVSYKTGPFIIGVIGSSTIVAELRTYTAGKSVGNQPIMVKTFKNPVDITACQILFVTFSETKQMLNILPQLDAKSTLIIAEKNGAIDQGAAINFVVIGDKLKFELSPSNATKYEIKISSKLNEMAYKVY
jgi:hypothetical protein